MICASIECDYGYINASSSARTHFYSQIANIIRIMLISIVAVRIVFVVAFACVVRMRLANVYFARDITTIRHRCAGCWSAPDRCQTASKHFESFCGKVKYFGARLIFAMLKVCNYIRVQLRLKQPRVMVMNLS